MENPRNSNLYGGGEDNRNCIGRYLQNQNLSTGEQNFLGINQTAAETESMKQLRTEPVCFDQLYDNRFPSISQQNFQMNSQTGVERELRRQQHSGQRQPAPGLSYEMFQDMLLNLRMNPSTDQNIPLINTPAAETEPTRQQQPDQRQHEDISIADSNSRIINIMTAEDRLAKKRACDKAYRDREKAKKRRMESELETLKAENKSLSKELDELRNNFDELKKKYEKQHENDQLVKSNLKTLEDENKSLKIENVSINQHFESQSKELDGIRNNFDELKRKYEDQQLLIAKKFLHFENPSNAEPVPHPPLPSLSNGDPLDPTEMPRCSEDLDSACSTPYFSAPSSPIQTAGYFYSAPACPMPLALLSSAASAVAYHSSEPSLMSFQYQTAPFEFSSGGSVIGSMSSADELFLNGQIRPMDLSSHSQKQRISAPLIDPNVEDEEIKNKNGDPLEKGEGSRGRDLKHRSRSLHRKARSLSPLRNLEFRRREETVTENDELARAFWRVCKILTRAKSVSNFEIEESRHRCRFCESPLALKDDFLSQVRNKIEIKN